MKVYVLFDKVSKQWTPTFEQPTDDAARRALKKDTAIMASVDDFMIFKICDKYDLSDVDGDIPEDFDWSSALRFQYRTFTPSELKDFLNYGKEE